MSKSTIDHCKDLLAEREFDQRNAAMSQRESVMLLDKCDELAEQVEMLRVALKDTAQSLAWQAHGECRGFSDGLLPPNEALDKARKALTLPNTAAILRQRDARILREAALIFDKEAGLAGCDNMTTVAGDRLRKMAKELENGE